MTPRELGGWVPAETHKHYDAAGNLTGWTVVEREPRIDDVDRNDLLALAKYEAEICQCGFHPSVANDPENVFQPGARTCPVCAGAAVWQRVLHAGDEKAKGSKDAPPTAPQAADGRLAFMRLLSPQEAAAASPAKT
jgi:hypothetical protein